MALLLYFLALVACSGEGLGAPPTLNQTLTQNVTDSNLSSLSTRHNPHIHHSHSISPVAIPTPSNLANTSVSAMSPSSTSVVVVTDVATAFQTTTVSAQPSNTLMAGTTTPTGLSSQWVAPADMTDLSSFKVTQFASGENDISFVSSIPSVASTTSGGGTFLQVDYPAGSANPASQPIGGADFYADPLDLTGAQNVTLSYSVFFPSGFNWVLGGKLPGLYGGHTGCSGGSAATDCFSTRLMWRPQGAGELYLYAPKDSQTAALCNDPQSVCNMAYGFSIGRGSFNFNAGGWTHVEQTVALNTPGQNDGGFALWVNGQLAVSRSDIFYRSAAQQSEEFLGIFFSTFFGGHGQQYATPVDQHTWFKDFELVRHD